MSVAILLGNSVIRLGDQGTVVRAAQIALGALGYPLNGTGYFGSQTDTAVTDFQKRQALTADGQIGPITATAIDAAVAATNGGSRTVLPAESKRPLWLQAALGWVGTKEQPGAGDNPVILNWAKGQGGDIAAEYTHDAVPWCALLANQVLQQAEIKGTGTLWALDFAKWGVRLAGPAVGAFVPMKRNGGGHIAIVAGKDQNGNLMCVGGNQSDMVCVKPFDPARVVSYRWPEAAPLPDAIGMGSLPIVRSDGRLSTNEG